MDSKKILVIAVIAIVAVAGVAVAIFAMQNNGQAGELKVAYLKKNSYETEMVAENKNFFDGIKVTGVPVTGSGQQSVNALLAEEVDIAATGQGPVANAMHTNPDDIVIVCGVNHSTGGQVWVTKTDLGIVTYDKSTDNKTAVKASFETAASTLGHAIKFGIQKGATTESEFKGWLKFMDIDFIDFGDAATDGKPVKLIDLQANTLVTTMSTTNDIDTMAASQPFPSQALSKISGSKMIGSNADNGSYDLSMYITTKKVYNEKKDLIEKFVEGLKKTSEYMADAKNTDECKQICVDVIGESSKAAVDEAFKIADWKTDWSDEMANTLFKTCEKKKYTEITLEKCKDCPFF